MSESAGENRRAFVTVSVDDGHPTDLRTAELLHKHGLKAPKQFPAYRGWLKSITDPHWHLIVSQADPAELYGYPQDPAESQNVVDSPRGREVLSSVQTELWNQVNSEHRNTAGSTSPVNEIKIARIPQ